MGVYFVISSILLGVGLAMDAFSVSLANGLNEVKMKKSKMCIIAGVFAVFQFVMPMIGWFCVSTAVQRFEVFAKFVPWIAMILLSCIGGSMLIDGIKNRDGKQEPVAVGILSLIIQGIATSIDALSVGFTISEYNFIQALCACAIIAITTFAICVFGVFMGKRAGTKLCGYAGILGGAILIFIGLEILITSFI